MLLKPWQVWSIDHLSRKPVPVFNHPVSNKMLSTIRSEPLLVQFWTLPMPLVTGAQEEEISTSLSASPSCLESNQFVPQHSSLQTRHAQSHDTQDIPSSLLNIFATLLWTHLNSFTSFFNCRAQNSTQHTGEAAPALTTVARSPLLTGFLWCVQCAPGCALPSWQWRSDTLSQIKGRGRNSLEEMHTWRLSPDWSSAHHIVLNTRLPLPFMVCTNNWFNVFYSDQKADP